MPKGARYNSGQKYCGTCGSWAGARELDGTSRYAIMEESMGKCLNRKGKYGIGNIGDQNKCNAWSKWGPLK